MDRDRSKPITAALDGPMVVGFAGLFAGLLLEAFLSPEKADARYIFWTLLAIITALEVRYWWDNRKQRGAPGTGPKVSSAARSASPSPASESALRARHPTVPMLNAHGEIVQVPRGIEAEDEQE